jgi:hypothetical protein
MDVVAEIGSCWSQGREAGCPGRKTGNAHQPVSGSFQVEGCCSGQMLEMRFRQPAVTAATHPQDKGRLGDEAFHPGPGGILLFEHLAFLSPASFLERQVFGLGV